VLGYVCPDFLFASPTCLGFERGSCWLGFIYLSTTLMSPPDGAFAEVSFFSRLIPGVPARPAVGGLRLVGSGMGAGIYVQTDRKCTFALDDLRSFLWHAALCRVWVGCQESVLTERLTIAQLGALELLLEGS
jgi:hypothetical protein